MGGVWPWAWLRGRVGARPLLLAPSAPADLISDTSRGLAWPAHLEAMRFFFLNVRDG